MQLSSVAYPPTRSIHPSFSHPIKHSSTVTYAPRAYYGEQGHRTWRLMLLGLSQLGDRALEGPYG